MKTSLKKIIDCQYLGVELKASGKSKQDCMAIGDAISSAFGGHEKEFDYPRIHDAVESIDKKIYYYNPDFELTNIIDGSVYFNKDEFYIIMKSWHGTRRTIISLARVIGHYILHYLQLDMDTSLKNAEKPDKLCWVRRDDQTLIARESLWFAAGFLMPETLLVKYARHYDSDIQTLACIFSISTRLVEMRLETIDNKLLQK